jgi:hypothetical protein
VLYLVKTLVLVVSFVRIENAPTAVFRLVVCTKLATVVKRKDYAAHNWYGFICNVTRDTYLYVAIERFTKLCGVYTYDTDIDNIHVVY